MTKNISQSMFFREKAGNVAILFAILIVPIIIIIGLSIDYTNMSRKKSELQDALDATTLSVASYIKSNVDKRDAISSNINDKIKKYSASLFKKNLKSIDPENVNIITQLPTSLNPFIYQKASLKYKPFFSSIITFLLSETKTQDFYTIDVSSEVRLEGTIEIALVFDNSSSMSEQGQKTNTPRIDLLKKAALEFVDIVHKKGASIKYVDNPTQIGLVPFSAFVNVGSQYAGSSWMDTKGISPIHHENFYWPVEFEDGRKIEKIGNVYKKTGHNWPIGEQGQIVTRFTMLNDMKHISRSSTHVSFQWKGCVESRPYPHNILDTLVSVKNPETLFVPSLAPDVDSDSTQEKNSNLLYFLLDYWHDPNNFQDGRKYFYPMKKEPNSDRQGPNYGCGIMPITSLKDISSKKGLELIKRSIETMYPNGSTNIVEGLAWGWRVLSKGEPFTEGRSYEARGNDKIIILLTDGSNTYSKDDYSSYGFSSDADERLFAGKKYRTLHGIKDFFQTSFISYITEMDNQLYHACTAAKERGIKIITIALDIESKRTIKLLQGCASSSASTSNKDRKLFWNSEGSSLKEDFKKIADEVSNIRMTR